MSSRVWVLAGALSGVVAGLAIMAAIVALGPEPSIALATPVPSAAGRVSGSPAPGASLGPSTTATAAPGAGSPLPSGAASPAATRSVMHIGQPAPVLAVTQVGGGSIDLAELRGRPVWVVFMSTTCARCGAEVTLVNGFLARYGSAGLVVLAIDVKESEGTVATFAKRLSATFPFGLDLDGSAQTEWEVPGLPAHFWVDKDGIIRDALPGPAGSAGAVHGLQQILPGVTVTP